MSFHSTVERLRAARRTRSGDRERGERGVTLIEMVFTVGLLGIVTVVIFSALTEVQKSETFVRGRAEALDEMRITMNRMTRDLRQAGAVTGTPTTSHIEVDSYVDGVSAHVVYDATSGTLTRQVDLDPATTLQEGLTSDSIFTYEPSSDDVELVQILLAVRPSNLPDTTVTIDSEVRLRNLQETS